MRLPWRAPGCHRDEKVCTFVKFEAILPLLCCLLDPLANKDCRALSSMINLWIDSRICEKYRNLLSARQRSNNYLELSKENILGNTLSHWPCFTWKLFMIWFYKSINQFFRRSHHVLEIHVLIIEENNLFSQLSWKFSYTLHCEKSVRIRSYSGPVFAAFVLNTKRCGVSLRIQYKCRKTLTRITPNLDTFSTLLRSTVL